MCGGESAFYTKWWGSKDKEEPCDRSWKVIEGNSGTERRNRKWKDSAMGTCLAGSVLQGQKGSDAGESWEMWVHTQPDQTWQRTRGAASVRGFRPFAELFGFIMILAKGIWDSSLRVLKKEKDGTRSTFVFCPFRVSYSLDTVEWMSVFLPTFPPIHPGAGEDGTQVILPGR